MFWKYPRAVAMGGDYCRTKRKSPGLTHAKAGTAMSAEKAPTRFFRIQSKADVKQPKKWDTAVYSNESQYLDIGNGMQGGIYENLMRKVKVYAFLANIRGKLLNWGVEERLRRSMLGFGAPHDRSHPISLSLAKRYVPDRGLGNGEFDTHLFGVVPGDHAAVRDWGNRHDFGDCAGGGLLGNVQAQRRFDRSPRLNPRQLDAREATHPA